MKNISTILYGVWPWTFTIIVGSIIVWLTLGRPPKVDDDIPLWEHTDKIVHACMFGGLFYAASLDWYRRRPRIIPSRQHSVMWRIAIFCSVFGGLIEILQPYFNRTADIWDFAADIIGILLAWLLTPYFIPRRSKAAR